jgi:hypothetical protein
MALNLGAMIQAARTQKNPAGDFIANMDNQQDRNRAEMQRNFNNLSSILGLAQNGKLGNQSVDTNAIAQSMGIGKFFL